MSTILNPKARPHDGSHLTNDQAEWIEIYMALVLDALELGYWRVHIARDLPSAGAHLMIDPTDGRRIAILHVNETWWNERTAAEKCTDITHEALHLAHHDLDECIRRFVDGNGDVGEYPMSIFWGQAKTEFERLVDGLSYVLAPHMPKWRDPEPDDPTEARP